MRGEFYQQLTNDLETARAEGLFKEERIITSCLLYTSRCV